MDILISGFPALAGIKKKLGYFNLFFFKEVHQLLLVRGEHASFS